MNDANCWKSEFIFRNHECKVQQKMLVTVFFLLDLNVLLRKSGINIKCTLQFAFIFSKKKVPRACKDLRLINNLSGFEENSILLHSGLNSAWHFLLSTRFSCCLKMKSVEDILGYIREQFYRFLRGCKPQENTLKFSKLISFLANKKSSLDQCQAWSCYYATGCFVEFWGNFFEPNFQLGPTCD